MNRSWLVLTTVIALAACGDDTTRPPDSHLPLPLSVADGAPELVSPVVTFWAFSDRESRARVVYHASLGATDSVTLVDFTVPAHSLSRLPDGSAISTGDSVLITITVLNPLILQARFEPSGLQFSESNPAHLRLGFGTADPDLNRDGSVDGQDDLLVAQLHIWRQEGILDPWTELPSTVDLQRKEVAADISGFTHYAVAY